MWQEISPNALTGLSPQYNNFIMFVVMESWGVLGWGRGEEGKAPHSKGSCSLFHTYLYLVLMQQENIGGRQLIYPHIMEQFAHLLTISYYPLLL